MFLATPLASGIKLPAENDKPINERGESEFWPSGSMVQSDNETPFDKTFIFLSKLRNKTLNITAKIPF